MKTFIQQAFCLVTIQILNACDSAFPPIRELFILQIILLPPWHTVVSISYLVYYIFPNVQPHAIPNVQLFASRRKMTHTYIISSPSVTNNFDWRINNLLFVLLRDFTFEMSEAVPEQTKFASEYQIKILQDL